MAHSPRGDKKNVGAIGATKGEGKTTKQVP